MTKIHAVIHHLNDATTLEQAALALAAGCDGVFLISHHGADAGLPALARDVKKLCMPDGRRLRVGVNLLSTSPAHALHLASEHGLDAVWHDAPGIDGEGATNDGMSLMYAWHSIPPAQRPEVFASVAFKYQPKEFNPARAAVNVFDAGFIPATSGEGTGMAPTVEKIEDMSQATEGNLAVASGMSCENVHLFAPFLSHILVASGVSLDTYHFDPVRLAEFVRQAKYAPAPSLL